MAVCNIRGSHPVIRAILSAAAQIAATDVCVLIVGEKGTGKELLARHIHALSTHANGPFVRVDCQDLAAIRGGADLSSVVAQNAIAGSGTVPFERARGGTLFLDQVNDLDPEIRARLFSTLFHGAAAAAGIRLLAARAPFDGAPDRGASTDLVQIEIPLPSLRQRRSDVPMLVEHFLELYATRHGVGHRRIETEAMVQLWQYDWPGNVRELESVVERVVVLNRSGVIRAADLPPHICTMGSFKPRSGRASAAGNGCGAGPIPLR